MDERTIWCLAQGFTRHLSLAHQPHVPRACHVEEAGSLVHRGGVFLTEIHSVEKSGNKVKRQCNESALKWKIVFIFRSDSLKMSNWQITPLQHMMKNAFIETSIKAFLQLLLLFQGLCGPQEILQIIQIIIWFQDLEDDRRWDMRQIWVEISKLVS